MKGKLRELRRDLGIVGTTSLIIICLVATYYAYIIKPLEARAGALRLQLETLPARNGIKLVSSDREGRLREFYSFFDRKETSEEWLAKLHGIATASGLELRAGDYQLADPSYRLSRYRVSLPVAGAYSQVRQFLDKSLEEVPIASLDGASFRRKNPNEPGIEADLLLTLYLMRK